ncbi:TPA: FRG domain-containing protein [Salmonella enterica subsp. houtenae]|nr:FRG domain-containing protein [Salmonella enterica subsp. houtenae]
MDKITSISDFIKKVEQEKSTGNLYRGHGNKNYKLIPSAFRYYQKILNRNKTNPESEELSTPEGTKKQILKQENDAIRIFLSEHSPYTQYKIESILDGLALAQHHGMPTRLIDWSLSPLVALFFAVEKKSEDDAAVYIYRDSTWIDETNLKQYNTLNIKDYIDMMTHDMEGKIFMPNHITPRIKAQQGVFSIHSSITDEFTSPNLDKIIIDKNASSHIKFQLKKLGISEKVIYPDLYGLCAELKWSKFEGLD